MSRAVVPTLLALASLVLLYVGLSLLLSPHAFHAANGITLTSDPSQLSEVRAPAGLLVLAGLGIGLGAVRPRAQRLALGVTAIVYGTYGLSRLVGVAVDGVPSEGLVTGMVIELVFAVLATIALVRPAASAGHAPATRTA